MSNLRQNNRSKKIKTQNIWNIKQNIYYSSPLINFPFRECMSARGHAQKKRKCVIQPWKNNIKVKKFNGVAVLNGENLSTYELSR